MIQIDMPMPDNCLECRFNTSEFGYCNAMPVEFVGQVSDFEEDGKPEWCPLKAQEPCEDAVSRKDVINVLQSPCDMRYINGNWHPCIGDYIEAITNLSAVAPKAQEPVVPIRMNHDRNKYRDHYKCLICDDDLTYEQQYCAECGRAVKWE